MELNRAVPSGLPVNGQDAAGRDVQLLARLQQYLPPWGSIRTALPLTLRRQQRTVLGSRKGSGDLEVAAGRESEIPLPIVGVEVGSPRHRDGGPADLDEPSAAVGIDLALDGEGPRGRPVEGPGEGVLRRVAHVH